MNNKRLRLPAGRAGWYRPGQAFAGEVLPEVVMTQRTVELVMVWFTLLGAMTLLAGCGGSAGGGGGSRSDTADDDPGAGSLSFVFAEDEDPAMAALPFVKDELFARTIPGATPEDLNALYTEAGATVLETIAAIDTTVLGVRPDELGTAAAKLADSPLIEGVQKSYLYEPELKANDPEFGSQGYLDRIGVPEAWEATTGSDEVVIAVLDTGVSGDHADLENKLLDGWNTFDNDWDTSDEQGHGTGVAGVAAAASNNRIGVAGISWDSPILPVRVTNSGGQASSRSIATGLLWAANHGAKVMNVSFAPLVSDTTVLRAASHVRNNGGLVFISAGNDGKESTAQSKKGALFVGATDGNENKASFSTYGSFVDLTAPGTAIKTTDSGGGYRSKSGTSFSSPIVAGVAGLVWSVRPELRPVTVEQILFDTAIDLGKAGRDDEFGVGMVDAAAAVAAAIDIVEEEDTKAPKVEISRPRDGKPVPGVEKVAASATDDGEIADVVLSVDGQPFATDSTEPYRFTINTSDLDDGLHTLTCVATDTAGNVSAPASVEIVVGEASSASNASDSTDPTVVINFPVDNTSVLGSVGIQATATDNAGLARAELLVDGEVVDTETISGTREVVSFVWDGKKASSGTHFLMVRVTDEANNQGAASVRLNKQ